MSQLNADNVGTNWFACAVVVIMITTGLIMFCSKQSKASQDKYHAPENIEQIKSGNYTTPHHGKKKHKKHHSWSY